MISRNGIYYDFDLSKFRHTVDGITYVFSSRLHLEKFIERLEENRTTINNSLTRRFNFPVDVSALADFVLYRKIESRGFMIVTNEGYKICQNNQVKFVGGKLTKKPYDEQ
ncbi:MAG: hypothetical protein J6R32_07260 [Bacteroidales bacterium]|nr:hypothetical protein [Bacteroidales bacterium]